MQDLWKAGFLLLLLFHRECSTTIHGGSNNVPAHNVEERSEKSSGNQKIPNLLGIVGAALTLGGHIFKEVPQVGWNVLNRTLNRVRGEPTKGVPSWAKMLEGIADLTVLEVSKLVHTGNDTCYPKVGCFRMKENMSLPHGGPMSPEEVNTVFYFFHNNSRNATHPLVSAIWTVDNWTMESMNDSTKPLIFVTHGFTGDITTPWLMPLVEALLINVNCNVIVADWRNGAAGPNYATAAANAPMAGVEISMLLIKIIKATNCTLHPDNVTLIGFSLGAHVVGFAGRHFHKNTSMLLGRITGLDPAGMLFENTSVSLSPRDAQFVDVIHTNMGDIKLLQLGLRGAQGHVDFYPNGGHNQPDCGEYPKINIPKLSDISSPNTALLSVMESVACSHYYAPWMFIQSLVNHTCNFTSYPCPQGWKNFPNCSREFKTNETVKGLMGYYSITKKGRGKQYLITDGIYPLCNETVRNETAVC